MRWQAGRTPSAPAGAHDGPTVGTPDSFRRTLPAEVAQLATLRGDLRAWLAPRGLAAAVEDDLLIAVGEAAANAIEHAYPQGASGLVEVEVEDRGVDGLVVTVRDRGRWQAGPVSDSDRGRGLAMMRSVTSDLRVDRDPGGTAVRFRVCGARPQAEVEGSVPAP